MHHISSAHSISAHALFKHAALEPRADVIEVDGVIPGEGDSAVAQDCACFERDGGVPGSSSSFLIEFPFRLVVLFKFESGGKDQAPSSGCERIRAASEPNSLHQKFWQHRCNLSCPPTNHHQRSHSFHLGKKSWGRRRDKKLLGRISLLQGSSFQRSAIQWERRAPRPWFAQLVLLSILCEKN
jgi:hypothetical protein